MIAFQLALGLLLLLSGAEILVRGSSRIASAMKISPLVIGLTIVAFGTSSPELAVSLMSSLNGTPDIALGNVVGSNIFNVLFILGISALITPLVVAQQLIRLDMPVMIGVSVLLMLFCIDGSLGLLEGALLVSLGIGYTIFVIRLGKLETNKKVIEEYKKEFSDNTTSKRLDLFMSILYIVTGVSMLVFGSRQLVSGAVQIAQNMGVSELVIGLTIIAAGTSLPEVATSIMASFKGERDIAVGNVVGSNIFNILYILGLTAIVSPRSLQVATSMLYFDLPVMIAAALACLPIFFTGKKIARWEGGVFLAYYIAYTIFILLVSQQNASLEVFSRTMLWFVLPITFITLAVLAAREYKSNS